ncbi:MAG: TolB family protein, partial [Candidatus Acidiferrales bacterium]
MKKQTQVLALFSILVIAAAARAQTKHAPAMDEILQLKVASGPRISPDGHYIAYSVRETDWKENAYIRQIWLLDVGSGASVQLTRGKKSSENAEWSPDGRWLAFVTEREANSIAKEGASTAPAKGEKKESGPADGKPAARQIWLISPRGGEAWQLTEHTTDVGGFHWSKDGKQIAFTAAEEQSKANKDRKQKYSDYEVFEHDFTQEQIWAVDVTAAERNFEPVKARAITSDSSLNVRDFSWSPDSSRIAFSAAHNPLLSSAGDSDIYLADLAHGNEVHKIVALEGPDSDPIFSPDGTQIAFSTSLAQQYFYYANSHIAVVKVEAVLTKPAATAADVQDLTGEFDEDPRMVNWGPDGIY